MSTESAARVSNAIDRLNRILPLRRRQLELPPQLADLYRDILRSYIELGRSLNKNEIAARVVDVDTAIRVLKDNDMVVFDAEGEPVGAYPFTMEQRVHRVDVNGHRLHCMCALDALAVSPMFGMETVINSACAVTGNAVSLHQRDREIDDAATAHDVYFGISWNAASNNCCATSLCTEMVFLRGGPIADSWRDEDPDNREIYTLAEAIDFAAGFFTPLLQDRPEHMTA